MRRLTWERLKEWTARLIGFLFPHQYNMSYNGTLLVILLLHCVIRAATQGLSGVQSGDNPGNFSEDDRASLCFVWYNVENLFYPGNDTLPADDEFTPDGVRGWSWSRYRDKLTALAKVIVAAGGWEAPDLVGLCEVENAMVLEDLITHPILAPYHYGYLHREGPDHRGMEVACLFRPGRIEQLQWRTIPFAAPLTDTREIMHISFIADSLPLDLFLVHLISKYGGAGATAQRRRGQAEKLLACIDSVKQLRPGGLILAAGDFNDYADSYALEPLRMAQPGGDSLVLLRAEGGKGSYKYRGQWSHIDQVFVCGGQCNSGSQHPCRVTARLLLLDPLLMEDETYGGIKPRRCYEGYRYQGGLSDHLPLVVNLLPL
jgi:endonuclease/exonuclease/phosphatase family metal-dependent hydrolase